MQRAVDDIQRQFIARRGAILRGGGDGHLRGYDQLTDQGGLVGIRECEADHVSRPIVAQVNAVECVDGHLVDQGDRD